MCGPRDTGLGWRRAEATEAPKRIDWLRFTPFDSWELRNTMCATVANAAPTAADEMIFLPKDTVQESRRPNCRENGYVRICPT